MKTGEGSEHLKMLQYVLVADGVQLLTIHPFHPQTLSNSPALLDKINSSAKSITCSNNTYILITNILIYNYVKNA